MWYTAARKMLLLVVVKFKRNNGPIYHASLLVFFRQSKNDFHLFFFTNFLIALFFQLFVSIVFCFVVGFKFFFGPPKRDFHFSSAHSIGWYLYGNHLALIGNFAFQYRGRFNLDSCIIYLGAVAFSNTAGSRIWFAALTRYPSVNSGGIVVVRSSHYKLQL